QASCTFEKSHRGSESGRAAFLFPDEIQRREFAGMDQESFYLPHPTCHYDLEFILEQADDRMRGMICYCRDLWDAPSMALMARHYADLLESLMAHCDLPIERVPWGDAGSHRHPRRGGG